MILAIDQGTTGTTCLVFDERGRADRPRLPRVRAALPAARLGRARRRRDLGGDAARSPARRSPTPGSSGGELDGDRDHQPARDRRAPGTRATRRAAAPRARLAGPAHRRALRRAARGRATSRSCASAPAWCSTPTSRRPRSSGCCATSTAARARERARVFGTIDSWLLFKLTGAPRRPTTRTPRARCSSTSAGSRWDEELLRAARGRPERALPRVAALAPASSATTRRVRAARCRSPASPATSRRRCSARPASSPGMAQEHLRHRQLRPAQHRRRGAARRPTGLLDDGRLAASGERRAYALEASIFVTGAAVQWLRDGLGIIERGGGDRGAGRLAATATTASTSCPR